MQLTVLIIDDSESVRSHVRQVLSDRGVFSNFLTAGDAIEGFKLLLSHQVHLVLCDLMMPGIDGFKFLSLKQSKPELQELPVIMLTGSEDIKSKVKGLEAGAADYLVKPFYDEELVARVKVHLKLKALQDELREKNQRLEELSRTDGLTHAANRRHLIEMLEIEYLRAVRYHAPLSYVMGDIDHFKKLNDEHGHQLGDRVLEAVADVLKSNVRIHDVVGRYGGEEFALVLPQTDTIGAVAVAQRCRREIEKLRIGADDKTVQLTMSFGVASWPRDGIVNTADLIKAADTALYEAKRAGRNRVVAAP